MNNKYTLILLIAITVAASGCVSNDGGQGEKLEQSSELPGDIYKVQVENGMVDCYVYHREHGDDGQGGMSCNFNRYRGSR